MTRLQAGLLATGAALYAGVVVAGWPDLVFALALEHSPLAALQFALLAACATAAALAGATSGRRGWAVIALLLLAAALDERFMGHEFVQARLAPVVGPRLAQGLTLLYLPIGAAAVAWLWRVMAPAARRWCAAALAVGALALAMDAAFTAAGPQALEETLEYAAEWLMLNGLVTEARIRATPPR